MSKATVENRYRNLCPFFNFLVNEKVIEHSPMAGLRSIDHLRKGRVEWLRTRSQF